MAWNALLVWPVSLGLATSATRGETEVHRIIAALARRMKQTGHEVASWPAGMRVPLHPGALR